MEVLNNSKTYYFERKRNFFDNKNRIKKLKEFVEKRKVKSSENNKKLYSKLERILKKTISNVVLINEEKIDLFDLFQLEQYKKNQMEK